jgi:hypothetical protein
MQHSVHSGRGDRGGGGGAKAYDGEKAWSTINHSTPYSLPVSDDRISCKDEKTDCFANVTMFLRPSLFVEVYTSLVIHFYHNFPINMYTFRDAPQCFLRTFIYMYE